MGEPVQTEPTSPEAPPLNSVAAPHCQEMLNTGEYCGKPVKARGLCRSHYDILYRKGRFKPNLSLRPQTDADASLASTLKARLALGKRAETYADMHLVAAREAAKKGISAPCEWALLHTRTITPLEKGDVGPRISVQVGIALPGLGMSTQVIDTQALPAVTVSLNEAQPALEPIPAVASTAKY